VAASVPVIVPYTVASDLMLIDEIVELLRQTGHPASKTAINRWIARDGLPVEMRRCKDRMMAWVSFSDILLAHKDAIDAGHLS
jgi:hypothetical protein